MNIKTFIFGFIIVYLLISFPTMLELGYVIDWIPETTLLQKFKVYVVEGLTSNYLIKMVISVIFSVIFSLFISKRKANKSK